MISRTEDPSWTDETLCICGDALGSHSPAGRFPCTACPCRYFTTNRKASVRAQQSAANRAPKKSRAAKKEG